MTRCSILFFLLLFAGFSSCTIQQRLYRDGFYIDRNKPAENKTVRADRSATLGSYKKNTPAKTPLIVQQKINSPNVSAQNNNPVAPTFLSPEISVEKHDLRDSLRNKKRQQKSYKGADGKIDPVKASKPTFFLFLIGLGLSLLGFLIAFGVGFRFDTMGQAVAMLLAVICIAIGSPLVIYGALALIVLGIIFLVKRHKEK
jgi:hypothetical protein